MSLPYRPEIDGLRAVAVLPVVMFHAGIAVFSGGYVGVDVFFVISGYLITGIIHSEIVDGRFSIIRFYERRCRRILPALFLVMIVCIPFACAWMLPRQLKDFAQSIVAVNVFSSNILFWIESGYFAPVAELKPLLHTWSLAVEEQFYVFFPLVLVLLRKASERTLAIFLAVTSLASLAFSEWLLHVDASASFYLLPSRAWELGVGALAAILLRNRRPTAGPLCQIAAFAGVGLIISAVFAFDKTTPFPGLWALLPVLGTALIIVCAWPETLVGRVLAWKPCVAVGLISYSVYLWHQPLFAFARQRSLHALSDSALLGLAALSILLGYLSWRYVERPFRKRQIFSRGQIFTGAAVGTAAILSFGVVGHIKGEHLFPVKPRVAEMVRWDHEQNKRTKECHNDNGRYLPPDRTCVFNEGWPASIAVWGDSHAEYLADDLATVLAPHHIGLKELTFIACAPAPGLYQLGSVGHCTQFARDAEDYLLHSREIETVILMARYTLYLEGTPFNNQEGGIEYGDPVRILPIGEGAGYYDNSERQDRVGQLFRDPATRLLNAGKRVVLVYPVPEAGWNVLDYLARESLFGIKRSEPLSSSYAVFQKRARAAYEQLDRLPDNPNLLRVYPEDVFCNTDLPGRCMQEENGRPLYIDDDHLNSVGATMLSRMIVQAMKERGWIEQMAGR